MRANELDARDGLQLAGAFVAHQLDMRQRLEPAPQTRMRLWDPPRPGAVAAPLDRVHVPHPGRPPATAHTEPVLHALAAPVRRRVVAQARPLPADPRLQRLLDAACQSRDVVRGEGPGGSQRVDARAPEGLVNVDVPEPRNSPLVEQG